MKSALVLFCVILVGCKSPAAASNEIVGEHGCDKCSIRLDTVITLGVKNAAPSASPQFSAAVVRSKSGDYIVAPTYDPGTATVFRPDGSIRTVVGRLGEGPGEMKDVSGVAEWFGDSVAVAYGRNSALIYGPNFASPRIVSFASSSFLTRDFRASGGDVVLARRTGTGGGEDTGIREFSPEGNPGRGFGAVSGLGSARDYASFLASGDTIWAGVWHGYEFDAFSKTDGKGLGTIRRTVSWFPPNAKSKDWGGRPTVEKFVEYSPGMFLVLVHRPREDFHLAQRVQPSDDEPVRAARPTEYADLQDRYDHVLELLDIKNHIVVASQVIEGVWLVGFIDNDEVYGFVEEENSGVVRVVVMKISAVTQ